jgi:hypothetical protein
MSDDAGLQAKLAKLPPDLRELLDGLPADQRAALMEKLMQSVEIEMRALTEQDVEVIKVSSREVVMMRMRGRWTVQPPPCIRAHSPHAAAGSAPHSRGMQARTKENSAYGFLSADVDFTWEEIQTDGYVALGAFDEREDGQQVPVAFIIAEVARLDESQVRHDHEGLRDQIFEAALMTREYEGVGRGPEDFLPSC